MGISRKAWLIYGIMLAVYGLTAFLTYTFFSDQLAASSAQPMPPLQAPSVVSGLTTAIVIMLAYGLLGAAGLWLSRKLDLPGVFSPGGNWRRWFWLPLLLGVVCGVIFIPLDLFFAHINGLGMLPHPSFPLSLLAALGAGIGEEIIFRVLVFSLWAYLLDKLLKRFHARRLAFWLANLVAALLFSAGHLGSLMILSGATTPAALKPGLLVEIFLMNGMLGLVAGERYWKDGLVAAAGVHFWADMTWHVLWGLI